jgi:hypothetical protein
MGSRIYTSLCSTTSHFITDISYSRIVEIRNNEKQKEHFTLKVH